jgi:hypothetical protein
MTDNQLNTKGQNKALLKAIADIKSEFGIDQGEIAHRLDKNETYLSGVLNWYKPLSNKLVKKIYEEFHIRVEDDKNLKMLKSGTAESLMHYIRLLPISAIGGSLNNFVVSLIDSDCEKIISPIREAELAITVTGSSMYPDYPAGSSFFPPGD